MAKRRSPFTGIRSALDSVIQSLLTDQLVRQPMEEREQARSNLNTRIGLAADDPVQTRLLGTEDIVPPPTPQQVISDFGEEHLDFTTPTGAPSREQFNQQLSARLATLFGEGDEPEGFVGPSQALRPDVFQQSQALRGALDERLARVKTEQLMERTEPHTFFDPKTQAEVTTFMAPQERRSQTFPAGPDPTTAGTMTLKERIASTPDPATAANLGRSKGIEEAAATEETIPAQARLAGATAGATTRAQLTAQVSIHTQFQQQMADFEQAMAEARERGASPNQTENLRRAQTTLLFNESNELARLENAAMAEGGGSFPALAPGAMQVITSPTVSAMNELVDGGALEELSSFDRTYVNAGLNFSTVMVVVMSGAQFRQTEQANLMAMHMAVPGETEAEVLAKQRRRTNAIEAFAGAAGKAEDEFGVDLGRKEGQLEAQLNTLPPGTPEYNQALDELNSWTELLKMYNFSDTVLAGIDQGKREMRSR